MKTNILLKLTMLAALAFFVTLTACKEDEEENNAPEVEILSPTEGGVVVKGQDLVITVDASDPDGNLTFVSILLNDSEIKNLTQPPYEATMSTGNAEERTHTIKVIATDANQLTAEDIVTFSIVAEPIANFTTKGKAGIINIPVSFIDKTTGVPTEWLWDFGDGGTSTEQNPQHTYNAPGTYTVKLTSTNAAGTNTNTRTDFIKIFQFDKFELVNVEGGTFQMGSDSDWENDNPVHTVTLDGFQIGKYEVTNEQYTEFLNAIEANANGTHNGKRYIYMEHNQCFINHNGTDFYVESGKEYYPAGVLSWYGAKAFAEYYGCFLPTEAQWEYAARGGQNEINTAYSGSNSLDEVAWYNNNSNGYSEVGLKAANELGIHDMTGNALEWCQDWYSESYYSISPVNNPTGPDYTPYGKVARGGSVFYAYASFNLTVFKRFNKWSDSEYPNGFRVALPNE